MDIFGLYLFNCKNILLRQMQYKVDFLVGITASLALAFTEPLIQLMFYSGVKGFRGWTFHQIIVFQGVILIWVGLRDTLFGGVKSNVPGLVRDGSFDRLLYLPQSPLILMLSDGFTLLGIGPLLAGIVVLTYSITKYEIAIGLSEVLLFTVFMVSGLILYAAFLIIFCAVVIRLVTVFRLDELMDGFLRFYEHPLNIYPSFVQWMMIILLPIAIWSYFPAQVILHRMDNWSLLSILVSLVLFVVSMKVFNASLRNYTSAGG